MIYNFRFAQNCARTVAQRLQSEMMISQGWGGGTTNLDLRRQDFNFVRACFERHQPEMKTTRVPTNLLRIRDFKDGDLLVTPHLPTFGKVTISVVDRDYPRCYEYVQDDGDGLNHRIRVKRYYGLLHGNVDSHNVLLSAWFGKLQWLRLPVLPIPEHQETFQSIVRELEETPEKLFPVSPLSEYLDTLLGAVLNTIESRLQQLSPANGDLSFESVCKQLLTDAGYTIVKRNWHRDGGDVDLQCARSRTGLSPFEAGEVNLLVQVKKYSGTTDDSGVKQVLTMMEKDQTADGCVMSLGGDFTPEAKALARENGILLMDGKTICKLLLRTMISG